MPLTPASNASHICFWLRETICNENLNMVWVPPPAHRISFASQCFLWLLLSQGEICAAPQGARRPHLLHAANQVWFSWVWWGRGGWIINALSFTSNCIYQTVFFAVGSGGGVCLKFFEWPIHDLDFIFPCIFTEWQSHNLQLQLNWKQQIVNPVKVHNNPGPQLWIYLSADCY